MEKYIIKISCGNEFMQMYNNLDNIQVDRLVTIDGVSIDEIELFVERLTIKVFQDKLTNIHNGEIKESRRLPIANAFVFDANNNYVSGLSVNYSNGKISTNKYGKQIVEALSEYDDSKSVQKRS